ncbi:MAG: hypothetical protein A2X77_00250 [Gammaproteobacteria bacterium GWE2_42_36]|nr:MAG: hypothetical protein A2X77_00250 [Gammaproteobacteria bacterium GWE2_42_36]HCU05086.1 hypothetical protein [Coxiellaceae bacterium]
MMARVKSTQQIESILVAVKQCLRLAIPLILTNLVQSASGFVGTVMVAHLGEIPLAANAIVSNIYLTIIVFMYGLLGAVSVLVAQAYGAKNHPGIKFATGQGFFIAIIFSLFMMILLWHMAFLLKITGQNAAIILIAVPYLHALVLGFIPLGLLVVMENYLMGIARARTVLLFSLLEVPLEILACYALVFGKFGFPALGLVGIGYAFAAIFLFMDILLIAGICYFPSTRRDSIFSYSWRLQPSYFCEIIRIGVPIGLMYTVEMIMYFGMVFMMGKFGTDQLAAHQIAIQYINNVAFMIIWGFAQATTIQVGYAVGENNRAAILRATQINLGLSLIIMVVLIGFFFIGYPRLLIGFDIDIRQPYAAAIVSHAILFLAIGGLAQLADTVRFIALGALRGLKDTRVPMWISVIVFWGIALPLGYLFGFVFHGEGAGLWLGVLISLIIGAGVLWWRYHRLARTINLTALLLS